MSYVNRDYNLATIVEPESEPLSGEDKTQRALFVRILEQRIYIVVRMRALSNNYACFTPIDHHR